jgi:hypothetical protein
MAKQVINIGTTANDGTGDPIRTAFDKVNDNFTELYDDKLDKSSTPLSVYATDEDGSQEMKLISELGTEQNYKTINTATTLDNTFHKAIVRVKGTINITIPSGLRADFNCIFRSYTGFTGTFIAGAGVTIDAESDGTTLPPSKMASLFVDGTDNYILSGELS